MPTNDVPDIDAQIMFEDISDDDDEEEIERRRVELIEWAAALAELGVVGEGDDGADHSVPADLLELHEVLEWEGRR